MVGKFFTDEFLRAEIRCGYEVSTRQKKIWAVELDLLSKLLNVCNRNGIKVFAFAGTLLGAVRHHGFIPWDDDMDVCLLREDYEKLLKVADKEFKAPYFFQTAYTDRRFHIGYARLRNSNTTGFIPYNDDINYNNGIFIDIFILTGYTDNRFKLRMQLFQLRFVEKIIHSYYANISEKKGIERIAMRAVKWYSNHFISYEKLLNTYYKLLTKYDQCSRKVSIMTSSDWFMERYWCLKEDLEKSEIVPFENMEIPIPLNFDRILSNAYGDYMKFPPIEKRGKWHENIIYFDPDIPYVDYVRRLHGDIE